MRWPWRRAWSENDCVDVSVPLRRVMLVDFRRPEDGDDSTPAMVRAREAGAVEIQLPWGTTRFESPIRVVGEFRLVHADGEHLTVNQHATGAWSTRRSTISCGDR